MKAHAPGPWSIGTGRDRGQILDADGERVCRLTNDPTAPANAAMIAGAPEMRTALQAMMAAFVPAGLPGQKEAFLLAEAAVWKVAGKHEKEIQA